MFISKLQTDFRHLEIGFLQTHVRYEWFDSDTEKKELRLIMQHMYIYIFIKET